MKLVSEIFFWYFFEKTEMFIIFYTMKVFYNILHNEIFYNILHNEFF